MDKIKTTNYLLLIIVIPILFYLLKILSFIFIPLVFSMFIALLFLPILRNLRRRKVPKYLSIVLVLLLIVAGVWMGIELIKLSSKEILTSDSHFFDKAQLKINSLVGSLESFFGIQQVEGVKTINKYLNKDVILNNLSPTVSFISKFLTALLTTTFFVVLWLAESINVERLINRTLLKQKHTSIKTFRKIEKDLIKFIKVKFLVSFLTGIGTGLACYFFDVSFPIFWGLFAFIINFVQMVGSFITVILLSIFAFVELEISSILLFFIISITSVQILFGAILEPIFMGKSFSINIIAVLVMLMFWGFIWGVPGLIMAIPITVFIKIILEQFPRTKIISDILSGS
ncbi:putative PurR-regulated permease PerM [Mesoflavibacter sabulilitoris]|uniref:AI-2E family transporter n=1 Tax=Mesoflavibacter zeaxanthinifaciens subsp. sabulilitoris TaxID=1520893 RepID=A0A2T1NB97_9FLAO|nr:AI-2E family transporter [Mesoflavibacter zeaxanthinifaciens]MBB3123470.1 putative PurR-regulated permease PerM [Mesoflavibacter zeaxanthinifaciens subsp. sabulilitoris]PSG89398.1 AI-2E family transporter [Mesoflavibacter zeaxanthinifaciens subsp. sabulilitoris]